MKQTTYVAMPVADSLTVGANQTTGFAGEVVAHADSFAFDLRGRDGGAMPEGPHDTANLRAASGGSSRSYVAHTETFAIQERAVSENPNAGPDGVGVQADVAYTLEARQTPQAVATRWAVRRLTPAECEKLQGVPVGWTDIPWRGKPNSPDGPRYKALGNSWAVPCVHWIAARLDAELRKGSA